MDGDYICKLQIEDTFRDMRTCTAMVLIMIVMMMVTMAMQITMQG